MNRSEALKYVTSTDFAAGSGFLPEESQTRFWTSVWEGSTLLGICRREAIPTPKYDLPKILFSGPISRGQIERTYSNVFMTVAPTSVAIETVSMESRIQVTMKTLLQNIEREGFENTLVTNAVGLIANDMEDLAINGNVAAYPGSDKLSMLRKLKNAWNYQIDNGGHVFSAGGYPIQKELFAYAISKVPKRYKTRNWKRNFKFLVADAIWDDWCVLNASRADSIGLQSMNGNVVSPFGIDILPISQFMEDIDLTVDEATSATIIGTVRGPFTITSTTNKFKYKLDGGGSRTITFAAGNYTAAQLAVLINTDASATVSWSDPLGRLVLQSAHAPGSSSVVEIEAVAQDCYTAIGLTVGAVTGVDAGGGGTKKLGTYFWLTDPMNLIWAYYGNTRYNRSYDHELDVINMVWFNEVCPAIQETDMIVKIEDIRCREYV